MMSLDAQKLEELLSANKLDEAQALVQDFLAQDLSKEEKGEAYIDMASLYMRVATKLNQEYSEFLAETIKSLQELDKRESQIGDSIDLAVTRNTLK